MDAQKFNYLIGKIKYNKYAVKSIYEDYYLKLKAHIQRRFGKLINPEDIAHDIFLKLLEMKTPDYVEYPTTWLYKLADNYTIDILRGKHEEIELNEIVAAKFDIENTIINIDVKKALLNLDDLTQEILYLHYWEGYSLKELANEFNISYISIRTKVSRAYKTLKKYL